MEYFESDFEVIFPWIRSDFTSLSNILLVSNVILLAPSPYFLLPPPKHAPAGSSVVLSA